MPAQTLDGSHVAQIANTTGTLRESLRQADTAIVVDTLHFETLGFYEPDGSVIGLESLMEGLGDPSEGVSYHLWAAVKQTIDERERRGIPNDALIKASFERFLVEVGRAVIDRVDGPQFVVVDPRRCEDAPSIIRNARRLVELYIEKGVGRDKAIISIPATDEGMKAAKVLKDTFQVNTNLYGVCSLMHAAACAEAGATVVTVPVGRLLRVYEKLRQTTYENLDTHPGVETIQSILAYFELHNLNTRVVGSGFRHLSEITPFSTFDAVCLSRAQATEICRSSLSLSPPPPISSQALLRARQAQYPTSFFSGSSPGFMALLSPATRDMVFAVLDLPLMKWHARMEDLEAVVAEEVVHQYHLQTLDLRKLYRREKTRRKSEKYAEQEAGTADVHDSEDEPVKGARTLGKALHFDEDEIF